MKRKFFAVEVSSYVPDEGAKDMFILFDTREDAEKFLNTTLQGVTQKGQVCGQLFHGMRLINPADTDDVTHNATDDIVVVSVDNEWVISTFSLLVYNEYTEDITVGTALPENVFIY